MSEEIKLEVLVGMLQEFMVTVARSWGQRTCERNLRTLTSIIFLFFNSKENWRLLTSFVENIFLICLILIVVHCLRL